MVEPNPTPDDTPFRKSTENRRFVKWLVLAYAVMSLGVFVFSLLGQYFYFAEIISNFRLAILLMLSVSLPAMLVLRRPWLALFCLFAIGWCSCGVLTVYWPSTQPPAGNQKVRILSFNVWNRNEDARRVTQRIREADADMVVIVEYANHWSTELEVLHSEYPHRIVQPRWHGFGMAIFSKHEFSATSVIQLTREATDNPMIIGEVKLSGVRFCLVGLHVLSPTNNERLYFRNQQFLEAAEQLKALNLPTIVVGDFNCTPWSWFLQDFLNTTKLRDSRQGFGYCGSWHAHIPLINIPIDHAFVSDEVHVHQHAVMEDAGSDHLPILIEVSIANEESP